MRFFHEHVKAAAFLPSVPVHIMYLVHENRVARKCVLKKSKSNASVLIVQHQPKDSAEPGVSEICDCYALRDAFEAVSTPEQAKAFLEISGPWRSIGVLHEPQEIWFDDFLEWQNFMREQKVGKGSYGWPAAASARDRKRVSGRLDWNYPDGDHVTAYVDCDSALEAIAATIEIDRVSGIIYRKCANCDKVFKVGVRHERQYCGTKCEHARGQRLRRKRKRKESGIDSVE